ncbi:putative signal protein with GAF, PAS(PAC) and GGDEF domains [Salinisphaera sp. C84B14]
MADSTASVEEQRLRVLMEYALMDSGAEAEFDAITRLAAQICDVPHALITFIETDRQWFKSRFGVEATEVPRDISFCAAVLEEDGLIEIPDVRRDPRFADNPMVVDAPYVRFYSSIILKVASGHRLGSLCVFDPTPGPLNDSQRAGLQDLADLTVTLIEQRLAKRKAETREAMLGSLLEALPGGVVACDAEGELTLFNSIARNWHQSDPMRIPQSQWAEHFDLYAADGDTLLVPENVPLIRALSGESVRDLEMCIKANGMAPRQVLCSGRPFFDSRGNLLGAVAAMFDITARKAREREIAQMRRYLEAVVNASTEVAIMAMDNDGTITLFNPGAERLLGYSWSDVVAKKSMVDLHDPEELATFVTEVEQEAGRELSPLEALAERPLRGQIESRDWHFVCADASRRLLRLVFSAIRDHADAVIGFLGIAIDRSQLLAMEQALHTSEARFRTAFDSAPQGMALVSLNGQFLEVNQSLCEMLDYSREQLLALNFQTITHPDDLHNDLENVRQLMAGEISSFQLAKRYFKRTGETVWIQLSVALTRNSRGKPLNYVAQIRDITAERQLDRMKSEFVAVVSHELRTPITSIKGALGLLNSGALGAVPAGFEEMLGVAQRNGERLSVLVNDLLDWEKLAADKMAFDYQTHDLRGLLEDALLTNKGYADSFEVSLELAGDESLYVSVDALRFSQVLSNLLSNAIKFSPAGDRVRLAFERQADRAVITVTDNGSGIPAAFRNNLFQLFAQADSSNTRRQGGTGLGLAISKQLIEQMRGEIGFESTEGEGTTFYLSLPLKNTTIPDEDHGGGN